MSVLPSRGCAITISHAETRAEPTRVCEEKQQWILGRPLVLGYDRSGGALLSPKCMPKGSKDVPIKHEPPPHPSAERSKFTAPTPPLPCKRDATVPIQPRGHHDDRLVAGAARLPGRARRPGWYGVNAAQAQLRPRRPVTRGPVPAGGGSHHARASRCQQGGADPWPVVCPARRRRPRRS